MKKYPFTLWVAFGLLVLGCTSYGSVNLNEHSTKDNFWEVSVTVDDEGKEIVKIVKWTGLNPKGIILSLKDTPKIDKIMAKFDEWKVEAEVQELRRFSKEIGRIEAPIGTIRQYAFDFYVDQDGVPLLELRDGTGILRGRFSQDEIMMIRDFLGKIPRLEPLPPEKTEEQKKAEEELKKTPKAEEQEDAGGSSSVAPSELPASMP